MARKMTMAMLDAVLPYAVALAKSQNAKGSVLGAYKEDPVAFVMDLIKWPEGEMLTPYQADILSLLPSQKRVAAYGPHGLGKTTIEALSILWFAATRESGAIDWKNPTMASAWRQLSHYLWPEVHKWARRLDWKKMGVNPWDDRYQLQTLSLKLRHGEAFALASDDPTSLEGAHADSLLYTFDESKAVPAGSWDAVEGAFSGAGHGTKIEALALACSTPGEESGRFYEICSRKPGFEDWTVRKVSVSEAMASGRISEKWVEQRRLQWGETSTVYRNRVLGEFCSSDSSGVIPLAWVEAAIERYNQRVDQGLDRERFTLVGVDVGGGGEGGDLTTMALRCGSEITEIRRSARGDTMATTGHVMGVLNAYGGSCVVDSIGIGAGVVARLRELDVPTEAFNAAESAGEATDRSGELRFANKRAWAWWNLRELLDPSRDKLEEAIALPPDDLLIGDLTAPRWRVLSGGRILIESKDEIRRRIGRSTDTGDAVVMAMVSVRRAEGGLMSNVDDYETRRQLHEDLKDGSPIMAGVWGKEW